jgi:hypothetical protein
VRLSLIVPLEYLLLRLCLYSFLIAWPQGSKNPVPRSVGHLKSHYLVERMHGVLLTSTLFHIKGKLFFENYSRCCEHT